MRTITTTVFKSNNIYYNFIKYPVTYKTHAKCTSVIPWKWIYLHTYKNLTHWPTRHNSHFQSIIFKLVMKLLLGECHRNSLINENSTLVHVMSWYHQATSHYPNQCYSKSMSPYGITRPHWVNYFNFFLFFSDFIPFLWSQRDWRIAYGGSGP